MILLGTSGCHVDDLRRHDEQFVWNGNLGQLRVLWEPSAERRFFELKLADLAERDYRSMWQGYPPQLLHRRSTYVNDESLRRDTARDKVPQQIVFKAPRCKLLQVHSVAVAHRLYSSSSSSSASVAAPSTATTFASPSSSSALK